MNQRDPFEMLAAINPVQALSERLDTDDQMLANIIARPVETRTARRRIRRRTPWIVAGVAVTGVALAAFSFLWQASPRNPLALVCYPTAQRRPSAIFDAPMTSDPVASCGQLWTNGTIASAARPPTLTACVLDTGVIVVVPGNAGVCMELGLPNWVGRLSAEQSNVLAFQDALILNFGDKCVTQAEAEPLVRSLMAQYGYADWRIIKRGGYSETRQCTSASAASQEHMVVLASRRGTADT